MMDQLLFNNKMNKKQQQQKLRVLNKNKNFKHKLMDILFLNILWDKVEEQFKQELKHMIVKALKFLHNPAKLLLPFK